MLKIKVMLVAAVMMVVKIGIVTSKTWSRRPLMFWPACLLVFCGDFFSDTLENKFPVSCDESSELNQLSGITKASSSRSTTTLNGESVDVKGSTWFQTSSPVSVLETSSACSSAKPAPINPKLSFLVKRDRSKRRRASTFNLQFTLPFISSTGSTSLVGSESESESHLTEKSAKKR
ncbi:hypothetical protein V6Z11_D08G235900 [Gossypium hirsutum]